MPLRQFVASTQLPVSAEEAFAWHVRPGAFQRLQPPWEKIEIIEQRGTVRDDDRTTLRIRIAPGYWKRWLAEHNEFIQDRQFLDEQLEGPFASWEHVHQFESRGENACRMEDRIDYRLPLGAVGDLLGRRMVERKLLRLFPYRHRVTRDDLRDHHRFAERPRQRVLVSGPTGLIGSALSAFLSTGGHTPIGLTRRRDANDGVIWDPAQADVDLHALEGFDTVVHLAGENVAARRWSAEQKRRILESREQGTRFLCETLAKLKQPPKTVLCASAVGFYGPLEDEEVDETFRRGSGFLAEVCEAWENATAPARAAGIRVVNLRFGVVLSPAGGALAKMLTPFQMGVGGRIGDGRQWMSWIALDDIVGAILHCMMHEELHGPVNVTAPEPVNNADFTKTLGAVLRRPTIFPVPGFAAKLAFGQMADEMLLSGQRVMPQQLVASGYTFRFPDLEPALRHLLGRTAS